ncbi:SprT-like domain-containing protein [Lutimonas sp.]|uniref:SprT-like domain-containing protein n=1 Tax=Lutimonas sp. TaxID=1872403 RepID=UPI003D9AD29B
MSTKKEILERYVPAEALTLVVDMIDRYPCHLKIVNKRATKHGDFRRYTDGKIQITINNDLNPYRFLLTLVHEYAHLVTFEEYKRVKPHGAEWKRNFKMLMLPFLRPEVFPEELLAALASHLINPKASSDRDVNLSLAFRKYDGVHDQTLIFELPDNSKFQYRNRTFIKGKKRRTKFECVELLTDKKYIFHPHAEVELIK